MSSIAKQITSASASKIAFDALIKTIQNPNYLITQKPDIPLYKRLARPSAVCLSKSKWLYFNSKAIKYLIFDIDDIDITRLKQWYGKYFSEGYTWLISTDNGVQLCFALRDPIPINGGTKKTKSFLNAIKRKIVTTLNADARGSMRNRGLWRNPLLHDGDVFMHYQYTLSELADIFEVENPYKQRYLNAKKGIVTPVNKVVKGFVEGGRNDALYWQMVNVINKQPGLTETEMAEWAVTVNAQQRLPLEDNEAYKTGASAWRQYHVHGKRLFLTSADKYDWKSNYNKKQYAKKRKEGTMTRTEAARKASAEKQAVARAKVHTAYEMMLLQNKKVKITELAKMLGLHRETVAKHIKTYEPF